MALSLGEDIVSAAGVGLAVWLPVVAFVLAVLAIAASIYLVRSALRHGARLLRLLTGGDSTAAPETAPPSQTSP
jgi:hypothetical protein